LVSCEDGEIVCDEYSNYMCDMYYNEVLYERYQCYNSNIEFYPYNVCDESSNSIDMAMHDPSTMLVPMPNVTIAIGEFHILVIIDGSLWAWGHNWHGQLGDGTTDNRERPVQIGIYTDWAIIAVGGGHTVALKYDGSLWAWGYNWHGQLGDGTTENRIVPVQIGYDTDWVSVFAGDSFTMAIKADGSLWAWGRNCSGQLGDGTEMDRLIPTQIGIDTNWVHVMPDAIHTLALKCDGSLWFWGSDLYITIGNGSPRLEISSDQTRIRNTPVEIGVYDDWIRMVTERPWHSEFLIKDDGSLWAQGNNSEGQLGDGTTISRDTFVQIGSDMDWVNVVTRGFQTIAIKTDGSVWSWGWAGRRVHCYEFGSVLGLSMIGDGGDEDRHSPAQIIGGTTVEE